MANDIKTIENLIILLKTAKTLRKFNHSYIIIMKNTLSCRAIFPYNFSYNLKILSHPYPLFNWAPRESKGVKQIYVDLAYIR